MSEQKPALAMRRTRFVCVSDTHNAGPGGAFQLPKGDVLIHAGDMTNQGSLSELKKAVKWLEEADFEAKIVVAGNHDITLDDEFYSQYGLYFHNQDPQDPTTCQHLLHSAPSITWLKHEAAVVKLSSPDGPGTTFKIFGSPFSPARGIWAFGYNADEPTQLWDQIPLDCDVVVTHTPPKYHCDEAKERRAAGCEILRNALWRVRPKLAICGHVHEGRGIERVRWDLTASNIRYKEESVERWVDPGLNNKKLSLIDLTKRSRHAIDNDGYVGDHLKYTRLNSSMTADCLSRGNEGVASSKLSSVISAESLPPGRPSTSVAVLSDMITSATRGQGGVPPSGRCDLEALFGRSGRRETCIINAAIMASSWPHTSGGGKKFHKPIVVDIDLPVIA